MEAAGGSHAIVHHHALLREVLHHCPKASKDTHPKLQKPPLHCLPSLDSLSSLDW